MKRKYGRRIAIWLVVCLILSVLSVQAFAEEQPQDSEETEMAAVVVEPVLDSESVPDMDGDLIDSIFWDEEEPNDDAAHANDILDGIIMSGWLDGTDYYRFVISEDTAVDINCGFSTDEAVIYIRDESEKIISFGVPKYSGNNVYSSLFYRWLDAGTYYIEIIGSGKFKGYTLRMITDNCKHLSCYTETTEPTCTEDGYFLYTCKDCLREWKERRASALGHIDVNSTVTAPTCTEQGYTSHDCTRCGEVWKDRIVPALGHAEVTDAAVEATCTTEGLTEGKHCSVCNKVLVSQTIIPALGHTEIADPDVLPTCMGTGLKGIRCGTCGEVLQEAEVIPALGHTEVVAVPAVAPTCEKPGRTERIACSVCAEVLSPQKVVPALGHTVVADAYRAPTCSGTGLTKGSHCSVCGKVLQMQKSIPMVAHTEEIVPAVKPTCTTTGLTAGKRCSVCKAVLEQQTTVAVLEHRKVIDSPGVEATCTENGSTEGSHCSVCKTVIQKAQTIPAHHNYANGVCVSCGITSSRTWVWKYDEAAKTLFIFGTGAIPDYDGFDNKAPWYSLAVENVIIDEGITRIGNSAFLRNYRLSSVTLPASLTSIGNTAFHECYALSSITLPDSITSIGTHAFDLCTALTNVTLPAGLTTLEDGVFSRCSGLRSVTLPESLTSIENIAFCDCTGLETITLPSSVKAIDYGAFSGCSNLSRITMEGSAPEIYEAFSGVTATVYYPANDPSWDTVIGRQWGGNLTWEKPEAASDGCGENLTWQYNGYTKMLTISGTGDMWNFTESNIPWKDYQRNIKTVMIADGVTGIGEYAFAACGNLCSITVPGSVTSIGANAFGNCEGLREIIFLGDAPDIDDRAFEGVTATVIYPEGNAGWTAGVKQNYGGILTWGKNPKGDTNADGSVSGQDAVVLLWNVLFPAQYPMDGDVDYNRDAIIDAEDAVYLLWHTLFPELYPLD